MKYEHHKSDHSCSQISCPELPFNDGYLPCTRFLHSRHDGEDREKKPKNGVTEIHQIRFRPKKCENDQTQKM